MESVTVADVMTRNPITIDPEESLLSCTKKMVKKKVGSLILTKDKKVVGFLSQKDILWALVKKSKKDLKNIKVKDISPKKVATIRPTSNLHEAIEKMKKRKFERLPVVGKGKILIGIISIKDILSYNPGMYPELEEFAKIRNEQEKLNRIRKIKSKESVDGICEECGESETLYRFNGMLICDSCKGSM
jgi:CBS domain-containing protein